MRCRPELLTLSLAGKISIPILATSWIFSFRLRKETSQVLNLKLIPAETPRGYTARLRHGPLPLAKLLIEVHQAQPVPHILILVDPLHDLFAPLRAKVDILHPTLHTLLRGQIQHLQHLGSVTNMARPNVRAIGSKVLEVQLRQRGLGHPDVVEAAHDLERAEEALQVLVHALRCAEDEVEFELVRVEPVRVVFKSDELLGAEFERVVFLRGSRGYGGDFGA